MKIATKKRIININKKDYVIDEIAYTNDNEANRIFKDFANAKYNCYVDDKLIALLLEKQKDIKLTKFPTAVITLDGNIIGQRIAYYSNSITVDQYFHNNRNLKSTDIAPYIF